MVWLFLGIEPEYVALVVVLGKIEQDSGSFEDCKVVTGVVDYGWNSSIWVQLDEPWFLQPRQFLNADSINRIAYYTPSAD